jgi:hypothetical protein
MQWLLIFVIVSEAGVAIEAFPMQDEATCLLAQANIYGASKDLYFYKIPNAYCVPQGDVR